MNKKISQMLRIGLYINFFLLLFCAGAAVYLKQYLLAELEAGGALLLLIISLFYVNSRRIQLVRYIQQITDNMEIAKTSESPFPKVIFDPDTGIIIWADELFRAMVDRHEELFGAHIRDIIPNLDTTFLHEDTVKSVPELTINQKQYHLYGSIALHEEAGETLRIANLYFIDMTAYLKIKSEYVNSRPVVSMILIDNYEELTKGLSDNDISAINIGINTEVINWSAGRHALLRKLEWNRYLLIFESRYLDEMVSKNFSLLESIRKVVNSSGIQATASIGLGKDGESFEESFSFASLSIEMALSRGGDQAVLKDRYNFNFYTGRGKEGGSRTKIKSRVMASSLRELILQSSQVFIMGHANADLDVLGAAVGVRVICRKLGIPARIIVDYKLNAVQQLLEKLAPLPEYKDCFITGESALLQADAKSLLIVVDTNRPDQVQYKPLLNSLTRTVVIDHHRRAADYIENVVLNLHEPSASSASELVADLLQYSIDPVDILEIEAMSVLCGIVLDTKQFSVRTGSKTFEAAAFLQRLGADPIMVKRLMQSDFTTTVRRYEIIQKAKIYRKELAICVLDQKVDRVTAAQAADELINISDITASFVLFPSDGRVMISARSLGNANVQVILEPLGGGGNPAAAGAQVACSDLKTVVERLIASIDDFYEKVVSTETDSI